MFADLIACIKAARHEWKRRQYFRRRRADLNSTLPF